MKLRTIFAGALALVLVAPGAAAMPGPADPLSQCLLAKTTAADRVVLIEWIFAGLARSEVARGMSTVSEAQRVATMRKAGALIERLLTIDCRDQTIAQIKADPGAIETAFGALGENAVEDLMRDPQVEQTFSGIVKYVDLNKVASMLLESGTLDKGGRK